MDDKVLVRLRTRGRHTGDLDGTPAMGNRVDVEATDLFRVECGKLAEHWALMDEVTMLKQIGVVDA